MYKKKGVLNYQTALKYQKLIYLIYETWSRNRAVLPFKNVLRDIQVH